MADGEIKAIVTADIAPFEKKLQDAEKAAARFSAAINKKLAKSTSEFSKGLGEDVKAFQKALPDVNKLTKPITELASSVKPLKTQFSGLANQLKRVATNSAQAAIDLNKVSLSLIMVDNSLQAVTQKLQRNVDATRQLSAVQTEVRKNSEAAAQAVKKQGDAAEKGSKQNKKAAKEAGKLDDVMDSLADSAALITGPLGGFASRISVINRAARSGTLAILGMATAITGAGLVIGASTREALKFETSMLRLEGSLKATGNVAGLSAQEIRDFARELDLSTLGSALEIEEAASRLLLFKSVAGDTFKDALRAAQDFASIGIGSVTSNIQSLGSALQDPVSQLGRLERKFGVDFPQSLKDTIEGLVKVGELTRAQKLIMKQLQDSTEGTASSMAQSLAGSLDTLSLRFSELLQTIAQVTGALESAKALSDAAGEKLRAITEGIRKDLSDEPEDRLNKLLWQRNINIRLLAISEKFLGKVGAERAQNQIDAMTREISTLQDLVEGAKDYEAFLKQANRERQKINEARTREEQKQAEIAKKAAAEENRKASLRVVSIRSLMEENEIIHRLSEANKEAPMTLRQEADERERITRLVRLGLAGVEGNIEALQKEYDMLMAIGDEKSAASALEVKRQIDAIKSLKMLQDELDINEALTEMEEKRVRSKAFSEDVTERQKLLNAELAIAERRLAIADESAGLQRFVNAQLDAELELQKDIIKYQSEGNPLLEWEIEARREDLMLLAEKQARLESINELVEQEKEKAEAALEMQQNFEEGLASSLTELIMAGEDFDEVLKNIVARLSAAVLEARLLAAIQSGGLGSPDAAGGGGTGLMGSLFKLGMAAFGVGGAGATAANDAGTFTIGNTGGSVFGATGAEWDQTLSIDSFHSGGMVGSHASSRTAPTKTFINAPRFHNGLRQNEVPAILEKGEEVIPKDQVGRRSPQAPNLTFNITTPDADSFRKSKRQMSREFRRMASP